MELQTLANLAEIAGAAVIVIGIVFGVIQIKDYRRQRVELAAIEVVRSFQSPQMMHAARLIMELPEKPTSETFEQSTELSEAAFLLGWIGESIGVLVHRRIVPLDLVGQLMGGVIEGCWERCACFFATLRSRQRWDRSAEWFEWLAMELKACDCSPAPLANSRGKVK